jgi:hypothetical protein
VTSTRTSFAILYDTSKFTSLGGGVNKVVVVRVIPKL